MLSGSQQGFAGPWPGARALPGASASRYRKASFYVRTPTPPCFGCVFETRWSELAEARCLEMRFGPVFVVFFTPLPCSPKSLFEVSLPLSRRLSWWRGKWEVREQQNYTVGKARLQNLPCVSCLCQISRVHSTPACPTCSQVSQGASLGKDELGFQVWVFFSSLQAQHGEDWLFFPACLVSPRPRHP